MSALDDFATAIINVVIESDEFADSVGEKIDENLEDKVEREVSTQIENLDLDNTIARIVTRQTDEIAGRVDDHDTEIRHLRQSVTDLIADNAELREAVRLMVEDCTELRHQLDKTNNTIKTLSRHVGTLYWKLSRVWFIGWMFKK